MTTRIYKTLTPTGARLVRAANRDKKNDDGKTIIAYKAFDANWQCRGF